MWQSGNRIEDPLFGVGSFEFPARPVFGTTTWLEMLGAADARRLQ